MSEKFNINKALKIVIILLTSGFFIMLALLIGLVIAKKIKHKPNPQITPKAISNAKEIKINELIKPSNCGPIKVIFQQNYIALYSKKCGIIKIIKP